MRSSFAASGPEREIPDSKRSRTTQNKTIPSPSARDAATHSTVRRSSRNRAAAIGKPKENVANGSKSGNIETETSWAPNRRLAGQQEGYVRGQHKKSVSRCGRTDNVSTWLSGLLVTLAAESKGCERCA